MARGPTLTLLLNNGFLYFGDYFSFRFDPLQFEVKIFPRPLNISRERGTEDPAVAEGDREGEKGWTTGDWETCMSRTGETVERGRRPTRKKR